MVYVGSKSRLAKDLLPIITKDLQPNQWYVEPFVGGANMIDKVQHPLRLGADNNRYLIALLKYVQAGGLLPAETVSKDEYYKIRDNRNAYPDWYIGYIGFICSFRSKFFGSYAGVCGKRNYQDERKRNILKQDLAGIDFVCCDYQSLEIPNNSVIYCDPPYQGVFGYGSGFDSGKFWEWCRQKAHEGHTLYISEYNAPDDFSCIWQKDISSSLSSLTSKKVTEKLFTYAGGAN